MERWKGNRDGEVICEVKLRVEIKVRTRQSFTPTSCPLQSDLRCFQYECCCGLIKKYFYGACSQRLRIVSSHRAPNICRPASQSQEHKETETAYRNPPAPSFMSHKVLFAKKGKEFTTSYDALLSRPLQRSQVGTELGSHKDG